MADKVRPTKNSPELGEARSPSSERERFPSWLRPPKGQVAPLLPEKQQRQKPQRGTYPKGMALRFGQRLDPEVGEQLKAALPAKGAQLLRILE